MTTSRRIVARCLVPSCQAKFEVKTRQAEKWVPCPKCGEMQVVGGDDPPPEPLPPPPAPPPPLARRVGDDRPAERRSRSSRHHFPCPHCGTSWAVEWEDIGTYMTCADCEQDIRIPEPRRRPS